MKTKIYGERVDLLTITEACKRFEVNRSTLHRWVKKGLPVERMGYRVLIDPVAVQAFLRKEARDAKLQNA